MAKSRNTYKYQFKVGNKIVHEGITDDMERREQEHKQKWPKGHIKQVGRQMQKARTFTIVPVSSFAIVPVSGNTMDWVNRNTIFQ